MPSRLRSAPAALAALVLASVAFRVALDWSVVPGWIVPDESTYLEAARGIVQSGAPGYLGRPSGLHALGYPLFLAPFTLIGDVAVSTHVVGVVQALVMSLVAVPVFLWGRRFLRTPYALLAAVLSMLVADLAYARLLMTETLLFPLVTVVLWATALVVERPTRRREAALLVALAVTVFVSLQALVLVPVIALAIATMAAAERRRPRISEHLVLLVAVGIVVVAAAGLLVLRGRTGVFGAYAVVIDNYDVMSIWRYLGADTAGFVLMCGFVPAVALLALALRLRELVAERRAVAAFASTAVPAVVLAIVETGAFSSRFGQGLVMERYLFSYAPPAFLAFAYWIGRAADRRGTAIAAALLVASLFALPAGFLRQTGPWDAPSLAAWTHVHGFGLPFWSFLVIGAGVLAAALVPRRLRLPLAAIPFVILVLASIAAAVSIRRAQAAELATTLGSPPNWVANSDRGGPTAIVYTGDMWATSVGRLVFWNPSIGHVYALGATMTGPIPLEQVNVLPDGSVSGIAPFTKYVVSSTSLGWNGYPVAERRRPHLRLWLLFGEPQLAWRINGMNERSILHGTASVDVYGCTGRSLRLAIHTPATGARTWLTVDLSDQRRLSLQLRRGATYRRTILLPQVGGHCSALVTTTRAANASLSIVGGDNGA